MYTGLLCGLGVDDCDRPIYPEHDMEVVFDCEFTPEDYITVNQLRFLMSDILKRGCSNPDRSYKDLILFQTKIKECFMKLIDKSRPSKELEFPDKPFEWKLVKTDIIINNEEIKRSNHMSIFPMLPGVSIKSLVDEKKRLLKNLTDLCSLANSRSFFFFICSVGENFFC